MNPQINTGAILSGPDYRDKIATATAIAQMAKLNWLPLTLDTPLGPVQMQGKQPACVSHSMVEILKLWWFKKYGVWVDFCPRFLHILSSFPGATPSDGRRPRDVLKVLMTLGCCTTATLANDVNLSLEDYSNPLVLTKAMMDEAAKYKIPGFVQVPLDFESVRQGMYFYGALSMLFAVGDQMFSPSWLPKDTDPLRTPNPVNAGHQMTGKGWTTPSLNLLRNEWSEAWGNKGETEYNPTDWSPFTYEAWAIADIPQDVTDFLKALPSPVNFHYQWNTDMKNGQNNTDIKFAQIALMILGFLGPINPADLGFYGPKTAAAVLAYQSAHGISPTAPNSIGPKTRAALNKQFNIN